MRKLLLTTALLCAAVPSTADAATRWVVSGGGWGHGLGMSQYGAYGYAQHGRNYRQILYHYYRGTRISTAERDVRVLLQASVSGGGFSGATQAGSKPVNPNRHYTVRRSGNQIVIRAGRKVVARKAGVIAVSGGAAGVVRVDGKGRYRDTIELRPGLSGGVTAVNRIDLEDYVKGVVPNESPSGWPIEALKAQAVAARSYAIATDKSPGGIFDHYDTVASQVYRGYDSEAASTNRAIAATSRQVLRYRGKVAATYFFSTSGGHTENNENVWPGSPVPYLRGVEDPYDTTSPYHRWRLGYSSSALGAKLGIGRIRSTKVLQRGASPRIVRVRVHGTEGSATLHGQQLKERLGLRDAPSFVKRLTAKSASPRPAAAAAGVGLRGVARELTGAVVPARPGSRIKVQRQTKRGWKTVGRARIGRTGAFRASVERRGVYRILSGDDAGPAVRVR